MRFERPLFAPHPISSPHVMTTKKSTSMRVHEHWIWAFSGDGVFDLGPGAEPLLLSLAVYVLERRDIFPSVHCIFSTGTRFCTHLNPGEEEQRALTHRRNIQRPQRPDILDDGVLGRTDTPWYAT
jgi:hypothetical protein